MPRVPTASVYWTRCPSWSAVCPSRLRGRIQISPPCRSGAMKPNPSALIAVTVPFSTAGVGRCLATRPAGSVVGGALGGEGLLPADVDQHRAHLADRDCDLEADLSDRFCLTSGRRVRAKLAQELLQTLDLLEVLLFRTHHCGPPRRVESKRL